MSEPRTHRDRRFGGRVGVSRNVARDWTDSPGVTEAELRAALRAVGNSADKVWEYLERQEQARQAHRASL